MIQMYARTREAFGGPCGCVRICAVISSDVFFYPRKVSGVYGVKFFLPPVIFFLLPRKKPDHTRKKYFTGHKKTLTGPSGGVRKFLRPITAIVTGMRPHCDPAVTECYINVTATPLRTLVTGIAMTPLLPACDSMLHFCYTFPSELLLAVTARAQKSRSFSWGGFFS